MDNDITSLNATDEPKLIKLRRIAVVAVKPIATRGSVVRDSTLAMLLDACNRNLIFKCNADLLCQGTSNLVCLYHVQNSKSCVML